MELPPPRTCFPTPQVIIMFEWFLKYFTSKEKKQYDMPKCNKCGLISDKKFKIEIIDEEVEMTLNGNICNSCIDDMRRDYDAMWLPPLIIMEE